MYWTQKEKRIKAHYNLRKNKRIWDMNDETYTFKMKFIENTIELPYPLELIREIKLNKILND